MLQKVLWDPKLNGFSSNLVKTLLRNSSEALSLDENATQGFLLACSSFWIQTQDQRVTLAFMMK